MTVSTTSNSITLPGNGATTTFSFPFPGLSSADIVVQTTTAGVTTTISPSAYAVALNAPIAPNPTGVGGTVTYPLSGTPLASGSTITIIRILSVIQGSSFANQGTVYPSAVEQALDYLTMLVQAITGPSGVSTLAIVAPPTDPAGLNYTLPAAAARAGQALIFDVIGNVATGAVPTGNPTSTTMAPVTAASSIAVAQSLLGITSLPSGMEADYAGFTAPTGWYFELGQAVTRAGDAPLLAVIAPSFACTVTSGSANVSGITGGTTGWLAGMAIESPGFPAGTTVLTVTSGSTITASQTATSNASSVQIFPYGNGDGIVTFNLPDGRGYVYAGYGGTAASRLTSATRTGGWDFVNATGGAETGTLTVGQIPGHTHNYSGSSTTGTENQPHTHTIQDTLTAGSAGLGVGAPVSNFGGAIISGTENTQHNHNFSWSGTTDNGTGGGTPHSNVQPVAIRNKIIKR